MGWLGALAGGAQGASAVIGNRITEIDDQEKEKRKRDDTEYLANVQAQIDKDKESRIEEANVRSEGRVYDREKQRRIDTYEFNSDPQRMVEASKTTAQAEVEGQRIKDQYADQRAPIEDKRKTDFINATDKTDYEQRRLDHIRTQQQIDAAMSGNVGDLTEREKKALDIYAKDYQNTFEVVQKRIEAGTLDPNSEEAVAVNVELYQKKQAIDALLGIEAKPVQLGADYAGLRGDDKEAEKQPEVKKKGLLDSVSEDLSTKKVDSKSREESIRSQVQADIADKKANGNTLEKIWTELTRKPAKGSSPYQKQSSFESDDAMYRRILREELDGN